MAPECVSNNPKGREGRLQENYCKKKVEGDIKMNNKNQPHIIMSQDFSYHNAEMPTSSWDLWTPKITTHLQATETRLETRNGCFGDSLGSVQDMNFILHNF